MGQSRRHFSNTPHLCVPLAPCSYERRRDWLTGGQGSGGLREGAGEGGGELGELLRPRFPSADCAGSHFISQQEAIALAHVFCLVARRECLDRSFSFFTVSPFRLRSLLGTASQRPGQRESGATTTAINPFAAARLFRPETGRQLLQRLNNPKIEFCFDCCFFFQGAVALDSLVHFDSFRCFFLARFLLLPSFAQVALCSFLRLISQRGR